MFSCEPALLVTLFILNLYNLSRQKCVAKCLRSLYLFVGFEIFLVFIDRVFIFIRTNKMKDASAAAAGCSVFLVIKDKKVL